MRTRRGSSRPEATSTAAAVATNVAAAGGGLKNSLRQGGGWNILHFLPQLGCRRWMISSVAATLTPQKGEISPPHLTLAAPGRWGKKQVSETFNKVSHTETLQFYPPYWCDIHKVLFFVTSYSIMFFYREPPGKLFPGNKLISLLHISPGAHQRIQRRRQ